VDLAGGMVNQGGRTALPAASARNFRANAFENIIKEGINVFVGGDYCLGRVSGLHEDQPAERPAVACLPEEGPGGELASHVTFSP
jgi:hypothetical protein